MPATVFKQVYQFKIFFREITPMIWRQFQVPETYTFWELNVAIQDMMGWQNTGMHEFYAQSIEAKKAKRIALFDEGWDNIPVVFTWETKIADYFNEERNIGYYHYPLGREWQLQMDFEKALLRDTGRTYPICLGGEGRVPPEPSDEFKEERPSFLDRFRSNPQNQRYQAIVKRLGKSFDPTAFDKETIHFSNPKPQLKRFSIKT